MTTRRSGPRIVIFGNSASGKSTLARRLVQAHGCAHLDLDTVAWMPASDTPTRRPLADSARRVSEFIETHAHWVVEGCYADLLAVALRHADEAVFLNPGRATCVANARRRPWEPHKYASAAEQDANLDMLVAWIERYDERDDEFSLNAHRRLFDAFEGHKRELRGNDGES